MRPRISQEEAAYIVEILTAQVAELKEKLRHYEKTKIEYANLIRELRVGFMGTFEKVEKVKQAQAMKNEIEVMQWKRFSISSVISTHEKLIEKYRNIAEGNSHRGTYKHLNHTAAICEKLGTVAKVLA
jgi:hypothetical protein